jgi:CubicO group peptidase (beta-lactamase class C family)
MPDIRKIKAMQKSKDRSIRFFSVFCLIIAGWGLHVGLSAFPAETFRIGLIPVNPETVGLRTAHLKYIEDAMEASIQAGEIPGAVVVVGRQGRIAYCKAFGNRSLQPKPEPMTVDTIFDMSSLTKVMATTPSIMLLVEKGILRIEDKVKRYLPNFSGGGKDNITVRQLLTHYSGLAPDFDLSRQWSGYSSALEELWKLNDSSEPGKEFKYSDLNYIALGEIIRVVTGEGLDAYALKNIFNPLGMKDTSFCPPAIRIPRIAPTETRRNTLKYLKGAPAASGSFDEILRGEVHDPTAWRMGGIAGHAGLFSTAQDLAIYAQMLLDRGAYPGGQLLSSTAIQTMTSPQSPAHSTQVRGYGWDLNTDYSSPRGDLLPEGYGHTGFTGVSLWIHPPTGTFIILLSNRVHPNGGKDINHLRGVIANIVAAAGVDAR